MARGEATTASRSSGMVSVPTSASTGTSDPSVGADAHPAANRSVPTSSS